MSDIVTYTKQIRSDKKSESFKQIIATQLPTSENFPFNGLSLWRCNTTAPHHTCSEGERGQLPILLRLPQWCGWVAGPWARLSSRTRVPHVHADGHQALLCVRGSLGGSGQLLLPAQADCSPSALWATGSTNKKYLMEQKGELMNHENMCLLLFF